MGFRIFLKVPCLSPHPNVSPTVAVRDLSNIQILPCHALERTFNGSPHKGQSQERSCKLARGLRFYPPGYSVLMFDHLLCTIHLTYVISFISETVQNQHTVPLHTLFFLISPLICKPRRQSNLKPFLAHQSTHEVRSSPCATTSSCLDPPLQSVYTAMTPTCLKKGGYHIHLCPFSL